MQDQETENDGVGQWTIDVQAKRAKHSSGLVLKASPLPDGRWEVSPKLGTMPYINEALFDADDLKAIYAVMGSRVVEGGTLLVGALVEACSGRAVLQKPH